MHVIPPGNWSARFPDGFIATGQHPSVFLRECFRHLEETDGDTGTGWQERCFDLVCQTHPEMQCEDTEVKERTIGPDDIRRFLTTMWQTWKEGAEPVSVETQNSRVSVCLQCPHKGYQSCFGSCSGISQALSEFTTGREIRNLPEIHKVACLKCGCYLEQKTMFQVSVLRKVDEKMGQVPDYWDEGEGKRCWMLTEP